jgi:N-acetylglucosaminyldiphosphoundecaprenol N-acetyl-beta-D-mannosaminyltransferase
VATTRVSVIGVSVDPLTAADLSERVERILQNGSSATLAYVHVHGINLAYSDSTLAKFFNSTDITYCDGEGVRLGAKALGYRIPERIALTDWVWDLLRICGVRGARVYMLGSHSDVVEEAARVIKERYPTLNLVGYHHGYFEKEGSASEKVVEEINRLQPDVLLIGFGMPLQEHWLLRYRSRLRVNLVLTAGSCFDYVSGRKKRCPRWMAQHGLEWLFRFVQEPRRLFKRYVIGNPLFLARVLWAAVSQRFKFQGGER